MAAERAAASAMPHLCQCGSLGQSSSTNQVPDPDSRPVANALSRKLPNQEQEQEQEQQRRRRRQQQQPTMDTWLNPGGDPKADVSAKRSKTNQSLCQPQNKPVTDDRDTRGTGGQNGL